MRHWWFAALLAAFVLSTSARNGTAFPPDKEDWGPKVKAWIAQLEDKDQKVRYQAIAGLAQAGPKAEEAVPALEKMKASGDSYNQSLAAYALAYIRPDTTSKSTPQDLMAVIRDKDKPAASRSVAAGHLAKLGATAGKPIYDELLTMIKDKDAYTRALAAYALPYIKPKSGDSAPALADALRDKNKNVARTAASSLAEVLGKDAFNAAPIVAAVLTDEKDAYNRALAAYVLGNINPDRGVATPALLKGIKDMNPNVQDAAKAALKKVNPDAAKREGIQ
jgi:hypothetical protein